MKPNGLLLAGGRSRRMQRDKASLPHPVTGQTFAAYLLEQMRPVCESLHVSLRQDQSAEALQAKDFTVLRDGPESQGPLSGIIAALSQSPDTLWLVVACDLPNLQTSDLETLIAAYQPGVPALAYRSSSDGLPEPLCALYHTSALPILQDYLANDVTCPRKILIRQSTRLIELQHPAALANMNTPDDLKGLPAHETL